MDRIGSEIHVDYVEDKADLELGLSGVRQAISVLRDYYGNSGAAAAGLLQENEGFDGMMQQPSMPQSHAKADGAGSSIISMLEVVESDFAKHLAI